MGDPLPYDFYGRNFTINTVVVTALSLMGVIVGGMYRGARCQKFMPAKTIKWMLAGCILLTAAKYVISFFSW
jgi:uncharacterized membrane protein YfcA